MLRRSGWYAGKHTSFLFQFHDLWFYGNIQPILRNGGNFEQVWTYQFGKKYKCKLGILILWISAFCKNILQSFYTMKIKTIVRLSIIYLVASFSQLITITKNRSNNKFEQGFIYLHFMFIRFGVIEDFIP